MDPTKEDALNIERFPIGYLRYLKAEEKSVKRLVSKDTKLIDIGCGVGRAIPMLAPFVKSYTGIDIDRNLLKRAKKIARHYNNVEIFNVDARRLTEKFGNNQFDLSIMLFNTFACVKGQKEVLGGAYRITKRRCFLTVPAKGNLSDRIKYYKEVGMEYRASKKTEFIYSKVWGVTRAYSKSEITNLCKCSGFSIERICKQGNLEYHIVLKKQN